MTAHSWLASANASDTDFPLQNLPYGVFVSDNDDTDRIGVAIGDQILDFDACACGGLLDGLGAEIIAACRQPLLNSLMALGVARWRALRRRLTELLQAETKSADENRKRVEPLLIPMSAATMRLPAAIGDYTDFFASIFHATNANRLFRPDDPLPRNYKYVPLAYHGRASSITISGTSVTRPRGQIKPSREQPPEFAVSRMLDYEMETGMFIGTGNALGEPVPIDQAEAHIFGFCLLNDWSARDLQAWESQPLGPFLAKNFATTISPWIVTMEALEPFRAPAFRRAADDPQPLEYLQSSRDQQRGAVDITLEAYLASREMRQRGSAPLQLSRSKLRDLYWTPAQLVAHHTSNGCNLRPGDLLGSGTASGPTDHSMACLLEITQRGARPIALPTGEHRTFLEDGDEVTFRGKCQREGAVSIGFGECRASIAPATGGRE
jgi:fumarylacetoacetase